LRNIYRSQQLGFKIFIQFLSIKLEEAKEEEDDNFEKVKEKFASLQRIKEKILSLTDAPDTPE